MEYEQLMAETYDAQYAVVRDGSGDRAFYAGLAAEAGGPIVELGCGTGRVLLPIAATGVDCVGVDPSAQMLRVLRAKGIPPNLTLVRGEMQTFELERRDFALAYSAFRAFQHLLTVEDQVAALTRIREHLRPGGWLALDVFEPNLARMAAVEEPESLQEPFEHEGRRVQRGVRIRRDHRTQVTEVVFTYRDDGGVLGEERVAMRWIYRYELEHLLWRSGFEPFRWSSGYDGRPYEATGDIVVVARRR